MLERPWSRSSEGPKPPLGCQVLVARGCPVPAAVFRDSQQVPQRRTDALFSRLSLGCQVLARSTAIDNCFSFLFFSLAGKRDLENYTY